MALRKFMKNQQHVLVSKPSPGEFEATDIGNISICLLPGKRPCAMPPNVKGTFVLQQYGFIAAHAPGNKKSMSIGKLPTPYID